MKLSILSLAAIAGAAMADLDPIVIKGSKFFYPSNNTQFYLRGVAYQQSASGSSYCDPLADAEACRRDVPVLQELHTNVIRTYHINASVDHSECMKLLSDAGIYLISDLSIPSESINRNEPTWQTSLYDRYTAVIDELAQYNNTIGFFAAAVRDMNTYIKQKGYRSMGVGYATSDDSSIRHDMADYFDCDNQKDSIDFWGYNVYSWCGNSNYEDSGYKNRTEEFRDYSVPVFFAEYGCNKVTPRKFTEIQNLFGDTMAEVWSGGIVYMYFQETNNYGLVSAVDSTSISKMADYKYYSSEIASVNPTGTNKASYTPTNTALQSCPTNGTSWHANPTPLPPTPDQNLCDCIEDASGCVVSDSVSTEKYGDFFDVVCGSTDCSGTKANGTLGEYGAYSMCDLKQKLAFVLNKYYTEQGKAAATACRFKGSATTKATTSPTGICSAQIDEAGKAGTGSVSTEATATAHSSSSSTKWSSGGAPFGMHPSVTVGAFQVGAYMAMAILSGLGMVLL